MTRILIRDLQTNQIILTKYLTKEKAPIWLDDKINECIWGIEGIDYEVEMEDDYLEKLQTITTNIVFSAETSKDITISLGKGIREILRGRFYISEDPLAPFSAWATYTFYNKSSKKGEDAFYRTSGKLVYTELEEATTGVDANIIPDDHTNFSPNDLVLILDDSEYIRLQTIANTMVAEDTIGAHPIDSGLVRVSEFSGFSVFDMESDNNIYLRINFASVQTVNLRLELVLRSDE